MHQRNCQLYAFLWKEKTWWASVVCWVWCSIILALPFCVERISRQETAGYNVFWNRTAQIWRSGITQIQRLKSSKHKPWTAFIIEANVGTTDKASVCEFSVAENRCNVTSMEWNWAALNLLHAEKVPKRKKTDDVCESDAGKLPKNADLRYDWECRNGVSLWN